VGGGGAARGCRGGGEDVGGSGEEGFCGGRKVVRRRGFPGAPERRGDGGTFFAFGEVWSLWGGPVGAVERSRNLKKGPRPFETFSGQSPFFPGNFSHEVAQTFLKTSFFTQFFATSSKLP